MATLPVLDLILLELGQYFEQRYQERNENLVMMDEGEEPFDHHRVNEDASFHQVAASHMVGHQRT